VRDLVVPGKTIALANGLEYGLEGSKMDSVSTFCTKCGKQAGMDSRFCSNCGECVIPRVLSQAASVDQADIDRMQNELAELLTLVEQPLQAQLDGINEGKTGEPTARDYLMEELLAVAVRSYGYDTSISERVAQVCWEIFSYLAPSKYDCLTPTTMAQLMATMAQKVPQRYSGELPSSCFLSLSLLSDSDQAFGTNYGQRFRESLCRFSRLISKTQGVLPGEEESELPRMGEVPRIKKALMEDAVLRAKDESESHRTDELSKIIQVVLEDARDRAKEESELRRTHEIPKIIQAVIEDAVPRAREELELPRMHEVPKIKWTITAEHDVSEIIAVHDNQSTPPIVTPARERLRVVFSTAWKEAIAVFSRISALLQQLKCWLNAPMK
jgi:hypothetical protein